MAQLPDDDDEKNSNNDGEWKVNENFEWSIYNSAYYQVSKTRAKKINDGSWRSCYGNNAYTIKDHNKDDDDDQDKIKKIQWSVQVTATASKSIMIGVCKTTWSTDTSYYGSYTNANGYMYYLTSPGYRYNASQSAQYGKAANGVNSIIIVTLNIHEKKLSFNIDGQEFGSAYDNLPNAQYRLCLDISSPNDEVNVISEKIEYYNAFSVISSSFKEWFEEIGSINESIKKQELMLSDNNNKNKNAKSKVNLNKLLKNAHYISVIKQNKKKFEKELKEFDNNIVLYEKSLQQYLIPPKRDNYKTWKSDDIIKWIITLDSGAYIHYTKKLSKALQENQITGDDLKDISRNDLSLFGVTVFKDRVNLMKHFESLTNDNVNDNNNADNTNIDEGEN